ncbi:hypothetical protein SAMN06265360_10450 [Haloechinothrix alba]|uniref:Uncharacterized protein n=1 Tax=Haloechinothrix alba TaxID=664784 RepID=A0A238VTW7_9PSEU|nr:hypothetical protein SAMN06265360_10450 [Haloechinothrix alba]
MLAGIAATAAQADASVPGVLRAAGPGWLAVYQVPVSIDGHELGVLPLAATAAIFALVAKVAHGAVGRLGATDPPYPLMVIAVISTAHGLAGGGLGLLVRPESVTVETGAAVVVPALLAGLAATVGAARRVDPRDHVRAHIDEAAVRGLRAGLLGIAGLVAAGMLVLLVSAALSVGTARDTFAEYAPGAGSGLGMLLLSAVYLPNAALSGLAFVTGPGFSIGPVSVSPFGLTGGALPGMPLLAAVPEQYAAWWPALLALPACAGVLVGWVLRRSDPQPVVRLRSVTVAGVCTAFGCLVLTSMAGGQLGDGGIGAMEIPAALVSLAAFGWIAVPAGVVSWLAGPRAVAAAGPSVPATAEAGVEDSEEDAAAGDDAAGDDDGADDTAEDGEGADDVEEVDGAGEPDGAEQPAAPADPAEEQGVGDEDCDGGHRDPEAPGEDAGEDRSHDPEQSAGEQGDTDAGGSVPAADGADTEDGAETAAGEDSGASVADVGERTADAAERTSGG